MPNQLRGQRQWKSHQKMEKHGVFKVFSCIHGLFRLVSWLLAAVCDPLDSKGPPKHGSAQAHHMAIISCPLVSLGSHGAMTQGPFKALLVDSRAGWTEPDGGFDSFFPSFFIVFHRFPLVSRPFGRSDAAEARATDHAPGPTEGHCGACGLGPEGLSGRGAVFFWRFGLPMAARSRS